MVHKIIQENFRQQLNSPIKEVLSINDRNQNFLYNLVMSKLYFDSLIRSISEGDYK